MQWGIGTVAGVCDTWVVGVNKGMHEGIRRRALMKRERERKKGQ